MKVNWFIKEINIDYLIIDAVTHKEKIYFEEFKDEFYIDARCL